jgi:mRNA interferase RelE/StbE
VTRPAGRWKLDVRPRAQRQLARLPEKVAAAAAEFITGPLLGNPRRVGHLLRDEYAGQHSARGDLTGVCVTGSTRTTTR